MAEAAPPRDAATIALVRDGPGGVEVLMLRRHVRSGFAPDSWVFPGGTVDAADCQLDRACWTGIDPPALAPRFDEPAQLVLGLHVAAVRETFEEAGLLLARHASGARLQPRDAAVSRLREELRDITGAAFNRRLAEEELVLELGTLVYLSRWVTPLAEPKRYDASFFVAPAPEGQVAVSDRVETTDQRWTTAATALNEAARGRFPIMYPTARTLEELAAHDRVSGLLAAARERPEVPRVLPHLEVTAEGRRVLHPDEPDYPHHLYNTRGG